MATFMSGAFTTSDRRKKVVTYGKSSRLPPRPTPLPSDEPLSPERSRKQNLTPPKPTERGSLGSRGETQSISGIIKAQDVFDFPSEDEMEAKLLIPVRKMENEGDQLQKHKAVQHIERERLGSVRQSVKQQAQSKAPSDRSTAKSSILNAAMTDRRDALSMSSVENMRPIVKSSEHQNVNIRPPTSVKANSKTTTATLPKTKQSISAKARPISALTVSAKPMAAQKKTNLDVFDLPSSDDEAQLPTPKPARRMPNHVSKPARLQARETALSSTPSKEIQIDGSELSNNLKRKSSAFIATATSSTKSQAQDISVPHSRKYRKQEESVFPGLEPRRIVAQHEARTINKPKRTRGRTIPVLERPAIAKGQSSPATLQTMLRSQRPVSGLASPNEAENITSEHDTMYEIPELPNTPLRPSSTNASGSVTPRQKALFGSLLGHSSSTTPILNISSLELTASKPKSLLGSLVRSKSDVPENLNIRKMNILGRLQPAVSESDDSNESGSSSESDGDESTMMLQDDSSKPTQVSQNIKLQAETMIDEPAMDSTNSASQNSQASQGATGYTNRQRLTYAKARSYLQEANAEDALLMSMDLDDPLGRTSQYRDDLTEDEEESQVRANHELKRQGQRNTFEWEMLIDDMSTSSSNGVRRSAILEFCTQMADPSFTHQLLDSTLAQRFLKNLASNGDVIFDFAAMAAGIFMLRTTPTFTMLEQIQQSRKTTTKLRLLDMNRDIQRIAKDRKSNLSKIAQESVSTFREFIVKQDQLWTSWTPVALSPQLLALKAIELEILESRKAGILKSAVNIEILGKLVAAISTSSTIIASDKGTPQEELILQIIISTLEAISCTINDEGYWSKETLRRLVVSLPVCFEPNRNSQCVLAVKFCMNITNNKPGACQQFSQKGLVRPLARAIIRLFENLQAGVSDERRTESLDSLILSLGAMINLAEHSDIARTNVGNDQTLLEALVKTFLDGSARAAQADSMEESQESVAVGYLGVLLGNMCLNEDIRSEIRALLPGGSLTTLVRQIQDFVQIHQQVNRKAKQYEGDEGQKTWSEYTARILQVVERLAGADT